MDTIKKKKIIFSLLSIMILLLSWYIIWYCTIYIYPEIDEMEIITPSYHYEQMIITKDTAPTISCHASTLAFFNDELYCAWFGGTHEGHPDVSIYLSKRVNNEWTTPVDMSEIKNIAHYNPVLFAYNNTLYLYYKIGTAPSNWVTYFRTTTDGIKWSKEEKMVANDDKGRGPVKNKPIILSNNSIIAGGSYEYTNWFPKSFVDISTDMKVWKMSRPIKSYIAVMLIQPTLIELEPGHVVAFTRSNAKRIFRSDSYDYGYTWSRSKATSLYNNNSGIDSVKIKDGLIAIVHNPVGENWGDRSPLVIGLSYDNGNTFTKQIILENIPVNFLIQVLLCIAIHYIFHIHIIEN